MLYEAVASMNPVVSAVVVALVSTALTMPSQWASGCGYALQHYRYNIPVSSNTIATEITHGGTIESNGEPVGWLFQTSDGHLYYEDGPVNPYGRYKTQPGPIAASVLSLLRLKYRPDRLQLGTLYTVNYPISLASLEKGTSYAIRACY